MIKLPPSPNRAMALCAAPLLSLGLLACTSSPIEPRWADGPAGNWYAGDFHVHSSVGSNDTRLPDGTLQSWPTTIVEVARERGMSFVVITDHSNSAGSITTTTVEYADTWNQGPEFPVWETAAALSSADFLLINGSEISPVSTLHQEICEGCTEEHTTGDTYPIGHVGCIPADLGKFDIGGAIVDRPPGAVDGGSMVDQCHARGGFTIINHPIVEIAPWINYDWTSYDYDAIEVFNGSVGWDAFDGKALDSYLCDRLAGRQVVAVGGSDNHRTLLPYKEPINIRDGPPLGLPMTSVLAASLDWTAIMRAVSAGRVVMHEKDTFVEFRIYDDRGKYLGGIGDTLRVASGSPVVTVWIRGQSPVAQELHLFYAAPDSCTELRQVGYDFAPVVEKQVLHNELVCAGTAPCEFESKIQIGLKPGLYFAGVGDIQTKFINARNVALTNAVTVTPTENKK
jgi:hypothetical protein